MISFVTPSKLLARMPKTIDAFITPVIYVYGKNLVCNVPYYEQSLNYYRIDLSGFNGVLTITDSDGNTLESQVYYEEPSNTVYIEWLKRMQLGDFVSIFERLGLDYVKKAALHAKDLLSKVSTYDSIDILQEILPVEIIKFQRQWELASDTEQKIFADMRDSSPALNGYLKTGGLQVEYETLGRGLVTQDEFRKFIEFCIPAICYLVDIIQIIRSYQDTELYYASSDTTTAKPIVELQPEFSIEPYGFTMADNKSLLFYRLQGSSAIFKVGQDTFVMMPGAKYLYANLDLGVHSATVHYMSELGNIANKEIQIECIKHTRRPDITYANTTVNAKHLSIGLAFDIFEPGATISVIGEDTLVGYDILQFTKQPGMHTIEVIGEHYAYSIAI